MTNCFRSYKYISNFFNHQTVNHSLTFMYPETCAHTNTSEGTWRALKYRIPPRNRTNSLDKDGNIEENLLMTLRENSYGDESTLGIYVVDSVEHHKKLYIHKCSFCYFSFVNELF
ncbi:hypothetical protein RF11_01360 [Thelohanellus kitauei]|uniref:Uncharacterized protein n=1 Tax=Thelohanellus kitauei TaxID=669202 RepID=A0A0C2MWU0_THEKT|nr:hypothetical protein RF11_01360 [Thelohanellus kitauei]